MKILIASDSMSMPRMDVKYEYTWPFRILKKFPQFIFIDKSIRGSTSNRLINEGGGFKNVPAGSDLLEFYKPDITIIQLGIVDCSPRYLSIHSNFFKLINNLPKFLQNIYYNYKRKYSKRTQNNAYVKLNEFYHNYDHFINRAKQNNTQVIVVTITPVSNSFSEKSPFINDAINKYNRVFEKLLSKYDNVILFDPFQDKFSEKYLIDELHYNSLGHKIFANNLSKLLCSLNKLKL